MTTTKQHARLLIGLLVAASVLVDLVVLTVAGPFFGPAADWPDPAAIGFASLAFSQVSLLAIWLVFGGGAVWWRWVGTMLGVAFWSVLSAIGGAGSDCAATLLAQTSIVAVVALLLRLAGGRLSALGRSNLGQCTGTRKPFQFSIRHMLGWTTALAVTLALLRCLGTYGLLQSYSLDVWPIHVGYATIALVAFWVTLGTGHWRLRLMTTCLVVVAAMATLTMPNLSRRTGLFALYVLFQMPWLLASLLVVRMAGYRLVWRGAWAK